MIGNNSYVYERDQDGRDAIERSGDSQDEKDVALTTPVSFTLACFDSIAEEAFAFAGTIIG